MPLTKGRKKKKNFSVENYFPLFATNIINHKTLLASRRAPYKEHTLNMLMLNIHLSETERNTTERNKKRKKKCK